MSQLRLFADAPAPSTDSAGGTSSAAHSSGKSVADASSTRVQSRSAEAPLVARPAHLEFVQWGRWSADAPPRTEMERRASMLQAAFTEHATRPVVVRMQVGGARTRWFTMQFEPHTVTVRVHWWLLQWPTFVGRMAVRTWQAGKLPPEFDRWIAERAAEFPGAGKARKDLQTQGLRVQLDERLVAVSKLLDDPERRSEIHIGWGRRSSAPGRRTSLRLGSMNVRTRTMLIHPVLDEPGVPLYVVDMVVWHELCHWVCPPLPAGQPNRIHHPEFRQIERRFPALDEADQWITRNFAWLARHA